MPRPTRLAHGADDWDDYLESVFDDVYGRATHGLGHSARWSNNGASNGLPLNLASGANAVSLALADPTQGSFDPATDNYFVNALFAGGVALSLDAGLYAFHMSLGVQQYGATYADGTQVGYAQFGLDGAGSTAHTWDQFPGTFSEFQPPPAATMSSGAAQLDRSFLLSRSDTGLIFFGLYALVSDLQLASVEVTAVRLSGQVA